MIRRMKQVLHTSIGKHYLPELLIYVAVWSIVFLFPVVGNFFDLLSGKVNTMHWEGILIQWFDVLPFLILFLLNNYRLAPRLFFKQKVGLYVISVIGLTMFIMISVGFCDVYGHFIPPDMSEDFRPPHRLEDNFHHPHGENRPRFIPLMRGPLMGRVLVALLMLSFNLAVKQFFKSMRDKERMRELERHTLQSELDYLKYQINPHFFMNTLNNIHALVDIDTEKAKQTIVELSRLMRYMLYEADKRTVLLTQEIHFLYHYIELMRIRYPDTVCIDVALPEDAGEVQVPPLLFISFVENAFKHGVNYQGNSFVSVSLEVEKNEILFHCSNSNFGKNEEQCHGIGLENIRKRLQLLFDDRYVLSIANTEDRFDVLMRVPVECKNVITQ